MGRNIPLQTTIVARASQANTASLKPSHHPQKEQCSSCGDRRCPNHGDLVSRPSRQRFVVNDGNDLANKLELTPRGGSLVDQDTGAGETCAQYVCMTTPSQRNFQVEIPFLKKRRPKQRRDKMNKKCDSKIMKVPKIIITKKVVTFCRITENCKNGMIPLFWYDTI